MYVLAPVKQQDEWDRPYIVRFIDIISDKEIERVKQLAKPRVSFGGVSGSPTGPSGDFCRPFQWNCKAKQQPGTFCG